ncbi:MAG: 3-deoxy-manno-octulosonate cytidylyltransferase [Hyphomicrobiales bacterium]|nr:3-deoxy-manno-octulosonate cytidylyltransferase [Hyphomicrobiales bacterium]
MSSPIVVIPARLASRRLPRKALADIAGRPMIVHVAERARAAAVGRVVVAADAPEILSAVEAAGFEAVATSTEHISGSDRIAEAVARIDPSRTHGLVVNVQGDEPLVNAADIRAAVALMDEPTVDIGTLGVPAEPTERDDPNAVKVVGAEVGPRRLRALYFTRAPAPWGDGLLVRHVGLYVFRRNALERFVALPPSPLELRERLEQLRALEAGMRIDVALADKAARGVDTAQDLERVRSVFAQGYRT